MYLARFLHLFSAALWARVKPARCQSASASGSAAGCMPGWEWPAPQPSRSSPLVGSGWPWRNPPTLSLFCVIALGIQELGYFIGFRAPWSWKDFQVFIFYTGRVHMPGFCPGWEQSSVYETSWNPFTKHLVYETSGTRFERYHVISAPSHPRPSLSTRPVMPTTCRLPLIGHGRAGSGR